MSQDSSTTLHLPVTPLGSRASWLSDRTLSDGYDTDKKGLDPRTARVYQTSPRRQTALPARHGFSYKPAALRWWFLTSLVGLLILLFGLVELSLRRLPNFNESNDLSSLFNLTQGAKRDEDTLVGRSLASTADPFMSEKLPSTGTPTSNQFTVPNNREYTSTYPGSGSSWTTTPSAGSLMETSQSFFVTPSSSYLQLGQITSTPTPTPTQISASTRTGTTFICFSCTPVLSSGSGGYLSIGTVTSTLRGSTPTTTPTSVTGSDTASTQLITVQETTTLPSTTVVTQVTTTNSAGQTVGTDITTTLPGRTETQQTIITLGPDQSWGTTTSLINSVIGGTPVTESTIFTDANGHVTVSTYEITHGGTTTAVPTTFATILGAISGPSAQPEPDPATVVVIGITRTSYIIGAFFPTFLAVLVALPLKLIDVNAKLFQPFHALASTPGGAAPEASVFLRFYGWPGILSFPRAILLRQPVLVASQLLVYTSALLAPLAAEAVAVHVEDGCTGGCVGTLGVAVIPARAVEALMVIMSAVLVVLVLVLRSFRTGVRQNPWSLAGMAALGLDEQMRAVLACTPRGVGRKVEDSEVKELLQKRRYGLDDGGSWGVGSGYGVVVRSCEKGARRTSLNPLSRKSTGSYNCGDRIGKKRIMSFALLTWWGRVLLIFVFSSILVILTYYENTDGDTGFERFLDSQGFGVRFFFTALGVLLGFCMATFFRCVAVLSPYLLLSRHPMPAERSILPSPPTNAFYGLYSAFCQRHLYLGFLALVTIFAEFLPVTLAHVPFSLIETWETQVICTWLSIFILALMTLAVAGSFFIRWPHMPVDPRTIAGALFYVCDSWMLHGLEGLSGASKRDRDHVIRGMRARYMFGNVVGMGGKERVGIDFADNVERELVRPILVKGRNRRRASTLTAPF